MISSAKAIQVRRPRVSSRLGAKTILRHKCVEYMYLEWGVISRGQDPVGGTALPTNVIIWNWFQYKHLWEGPKHRTYWTSNFPYVTTIFCMITWGCTCRHICQIRSALFQQGFDSIPAFTIQCIAYTPWPLQLTKCGTDNKRPPSFPPWPLLPECPAPRRLWPNFWSWNEKRFNILISGKGEWVW